MINKKEFLFVIIINLFVPNARFLCPLKTSEKRKV